MALLELPEEALIVASKEDAYDDEVEPALSHTAFSRLVFAARPAVDHAPQIKSARSFAAEQFRKYQSVLAQGIASLPAQLQSYLLTLVNSS